MFPRQEMADDDMMQLTTVFSANVPLSEREDDVRSICSVRSKGLMFQDQVQLVIKRQGYKKFFLRKSWNN